MLGTSLLSGLEYEILCGSLDINIESIVSDNRKVKNESDCAFFCIVGERFDAHSVLPNVIEDGAKLICVSSSRQFYIKTQDILDLVSLSNDITVVEVSDTRFAHAIAEGNFCNNPQDKIESIGVTGTKGKTTTAFMLRTLLDTDNTNSIMIGTNGTFIGKEVVETARTTPEAGDLFKLIGEGVDKGMDKLIMEVSSLGLKQSRVAGINYEYALFTNLYRDHIGPSEHKDMDEYFKCKLLIFNQCKNAIVNLDMDRGQEAYEYAKSIDNINVYTFGFGEKSICRAVNLRKESRDNVLGTAFDIVSPWYNGEVFLGLPGEFNVYNALGASVVAGLSGVSFDKLKEVFKDIEIPGRVQVVPNNLGIEIRVDYAHNGASLEALLKAMRGYCDGKLKVVYGCGGDRSKERRKPMGEAACKLADYSYVTTDNSRSENPTDIVKMILEGYEGASIDKPDDRFVVILDRKEAITRAILESEANDMVLIVGKGHEKEQIAGGIKVHFDDVEVASEAVKQASNK